MACRKHRDNLVSSDQLFGLKAELDRLDAQRRCMRVPDRYWRQMKLRARKSNLPLADALQSELNRYAQSLQEMFSSKPSG